jgi:hypothetical protein
LVFRLLIDEGFVVPEAASANSSIGTYRCEFCLHRLVRSAPRAGGHQPHYVSIGVLVKDRIIWRIYARPSSPRKSCARIRCSSRRYAPAKCYLASSDVTR